MKIADDYIAGEQYSHQIYATESNMTNNYIAIIYITKSYIYTIVSAIERAVQAEIAEVVGVDAMAADNGNDTDGVVESGGENSQDADIAKKIKHLENFARENGIKELSLASEEILKTSGGRIDLAECLILATKEVIAGKSVKELADYYELTDNPAYDSLSIYQARIWYLWQESLIKSRLDYSKSLEQVAHDAFDWRNYIRTKAREAMSDRAWAEYLDWRSRRMQPYKLVEANKEKLTRFYFNEFDEGMDFTKIVRIVQQNIKPDRIDYLGITDMHGFFEKDSIRVIIEYDGMIGNWLEYKGEQTKEKIAKVREWAQLIFDELMKGRE